MDPQLRLVQPAPISREEQKVKEEFNQQLYNRVLALVVKHTGFSKYEIVPQSRIYHDLGCDGIDGEELLNAFSVEFEVELEGFVFDRHFGPELPFIPVIWLYWKIFKPEKLNSRGQVKMVPITILDLYAAAESRKFPDLSARMKE